MHDTLFAVAAIGLIGIACQWLGWWVKLPAILFLLLAGILIGPLLGWVDPDLMFGNLLFPFVSLAVAVILFEGSLTLKFRDIRGLEKVVRRMVSVGLLITWTVATLAAHWAVGFDWPLALLCGALLVVTGPTVIVPMLRTVRPNVRIAEVLRWEGILIDPIGALLAVLVFDFIVASGGGHAITHTLTTFFGIILIGTASGAVAGQFLGMLLRSHWVPEYLRSVTTLVIVCGVFAAANALQAESGLLAVTVLGIWLANMRDVPLDDVLDFKESLSVLLISVLFILLAARLHPTDLQALGAGAALVFVALQLVARPLQVLASTAGSSLRWRERALLAWIAPRGIIAAAISALFAPRLAELGFAQAPLLVPLTFSVIIGTVVLQSATAGALARLLGVAEPEAKGVFIVGANPVARALGKALHDAGQRVLLADGYWESVSAARELGLRAYYGNPVSGLADRQLDLIGIGRLLALSPQHEMNALAVLRYRPEFGRGKVHRLASTPEKETGRVAKTHGAPEPILFGEPMTFADLSGALARGGQVVPTAISDDLSWENFVERFPSAIPLFAIDDRERLQFFQVGVKLAPKNGWQVHALHPVAEGETKAA
ncbi:MAG: sodium:proton antiporter [Burkholderiales bacterium]|nr:sodium:proton antiporter [Burkholderiales bacterium]